MRSLFQFSHLNQSCDRAFNLGTQINRAIAMCLQALLRLGACSQRIGIKIYI
jgi:hypothetical protein